MRDVITYYWGLLKMQTSPLLSSVSQLPTSNSQHINMKALVIEETSNGFVKSIQSKSIDDLPKGDVLIRVHYSSLNYKDALSASGNKGITKQYPHTPGIDAAGVVEQSDDQRFAKGDKVIVTGYDLGMNTSGGFGQYIRVPANWVVPLPATMSLKEAMVYGTAGFTAAQMIDKLGVGSMAVAILHKLGCEVTALSGKTTKEADDYLKALGANEVLSRQAFVGQASRPLLKGTYAAAIDTVGGTVLENMVKSVQPYGAVCCCGNAASPEIQLTVFPFILRGVSLLGVSSQNYPMDKRLQLWQKLATDWKIEDTSKLYTSISLDTLPKTIDNMLEGNIKGRFVVDMI